MQSLEQIIKAQANLRDATSGFLSACLTLRTAVLQSTLSGSNDPALENVLLRIRSQVEALTSVDRDIHNSEAVLNSLLNLPTSRAPINKLPAEILAHIFTMAVSSSPCCPTPRQCDALLDIPLVCKKWHQVATNNPSLWSHLDLHVRLFSPKNHPPTFRRIRLWLDRRHGRPIHLHFHRGDLQPQYAHILQLVSILRPHVSNLASLEVYGKHARNLVQALLALYVDYGTPGTLKTLIVPNLQVYSSKQPPSWPICSLGGLHELSLYSDGMVMPLPLVEFIKVLSDCPALHTLRLHNLWAVDEEPVSLAPVSLPCLRVLDLELLGDTLMESLIPAIFPGTLDLDIRMGLDHSYAADAASISLFERSNIVALTIRGYSSHTRLSAYMARTPNLRALILELSDSEGRILDMLVILGEPGFPPPPPLQSLCFVKTEIKSDIIDRVGRVVATYNIRTLGFLSCEFPLPSDAQSASSSEDESESGDETEDIVQEIRERLPKQVERITIHDIPPALADHTTDLFVQSLVN